MEDYILREIDKIGKLIEALCRRRASCGEAGRERPFAKPPGRSWRRRSIWISTLCWPGRTLSAC